jgi:hypothetical protein
LCLLLRASLPVAFWRWALQTAVFIINRLLTTTAQGYKTPFECVTGRPPNLKWLRIWGCKTYVLKPIAELRKDFDYKAYSGFLVGYAEENTGYQVFVPELDRVITAVHCIFNEVIRDPTAEYFSELERLQVKEDSVEKSAINFQCLVGQKHLDDEDGLLYTSTRAVEQRGYIVANRRLVTSHGEKTREEKVPIYVADVVRMTATLSIPLSLPEVAEGTLPGPGTAAGQ